MCPFYTCTLLTGPPCNCSTPSSDTRERSPLTTPGSIHGQGYGDFQSFCKTLLRDCSLKITFLMRTQAGQGSHSPLEKLYHGVCHRAWGRCITEASNLNCTVCRGGTERGSNSVRNYQSLETTHLSQTGGDVPWSDMMGSVKPLFP